MIETNFSIYSFHGRNGYLTEPAAGKEEEMIALGHTDNHSPWSDPNLHIHTHAFETYFLRRGVLHFLVADLALTLRSFELLVVKPTVPHAIIGGKGPIEHFGIRAPGRRDKQVVADLPDHIPPFRHEETRTLNYSWGYRIPLDNGRYQNNWCLGAQNALFHSPYLSLAYLNFPPQATTGVEQTTHQPHLLQGAWAYYVVLKGRKTLQFEQERIAINAGELCVVPPHVPHTVQNRTTPYQGFTLHAPLKPDNQLS